MLLYKTTSMPASQQQHLPICFAAWQACISHLDSLTHHPCISCMVLLVCWYVFSACVVLVGPADLLCGTRRPGCIRPGIHRPAQDWGYSGRQATSDRYGDVPIMWYLFSRAMQQPSPSGCTGRYSRHLLTSMLSMFRGLTEDSPGTAGARPCRDCQSSKRHDT